MAGGPVAAGGRDRGGAGRMALSPRAPGRGAGPAGPHPARAPADRAVRPCSDRRRRAAVAGASGADARCRAGRARGAPRCGPCPARPVRPAIGGAGGAGDGADLRGGGPDGPGAARPGRHDGHAAAGRRAAAGASLGGLGRTARLYPPPDPVPERAGRGAGVGPAPGQHDQLSPLCPRGRGDPGHRARHVGRSDGAGIPGRPLWQHRRPGTSFRRDRRARCRPGDPRGRRAHPPRRRADDPGLPGRGRSRRHLGSGGHRAGPGRGRSPLWPDRSARAARPGGAGPAPATGRPP